MLQTHCNRFYSFV